VCSKKKKKKEKGEKKLNKKKGTVQLQTMLAITFIMLILSGLGLVADYKHYLWSENQVKEAGLELEEAKANDARLTTELNEKNQMLINVTADRDEKRAKLIIITEERDYWEENATVLRSQIGEFNKGLTIKTVLTKNEGELYWSLHIEVWEHGNKTIEINAYPVILRLSRIITDVLPRLLKIEKVYRFEEWNAHKNYTGNLSDYTIQAEYDTEQFIEYYLGTENLLTWNTLRGSHLVKKKSGNELLGTGYDIISFGAGYKNYKHALNTLRNNTISRNPEILGRLYESDEFYEFAQELNAKFSIASVDILTQSGCGILEFYEDVLEDVSITIYQNTQLNCTETCN